MSSSVVINFDTDPAARYEIVIRSADAVQGDGVVLFATPRACVAFARLFSQLAEGTADHIHLGYTEQEPQGPGFRIVIEESGRAETAGELGECRVNGEGSRLPFIPGKWKGTLLPSYEQALWLDLFEEDMLSAEISFIEYAALAVNLHEQTGDELAETNYRIMHFAKAFVSAARRVWWVIETANLKDFPPAVADVIKLQRRRKKTFFEAYIEPRNAVEHASAEVKDPGKHLLHDEIYVDHDSRTSHPLIARLDLRASSLRLATGEAAPVTRSALAKLRDCYSDIISACMANLPRRTNDLLLLGPVDVSGWDT